jgi:hypothetical protein
MSRSSDNDEGDLEARVKRHLQILEMPELVQALAEILAWARKERPSAIALLDRALALDADRTLSRRIESRLTHARLPTQMVQAVQEALRCSMEGIPHPTEWKSVGVSVLEVAGVRSWSALANASRRCEIENHADGMTIVPTRNGGLTGDDRGFHELRA